MSLSQIDASIAFYKTSSWCLLYFTSLLPLTVRSIMSSNMEHQDFCFHSPHTWVSSIKENSCYMPCLISLLWLWTNTILDMKKTIYKLGKYYINYTVFTQVQNGYCFIHILYRQHMQRITLEWMLWIFWCFI